MKKELAEIKTGVSDAAAALGATKSAASSMFAEARELDKETASEGKQRAQVGRRKGRSNYADGKEEEIRLDIRRNYLTTSERFSQIRALADLRECSDNAIINEALAAYMEEHSEEVTAALDMQKAIERARSKARSN